MTLFGRKKKLLAVVVAIVSVVIAIEYLFLYNMVHKRPFAEKDEFEVSFKQPRQVEHSDPQVLSSEPFFSEALISDGSGEGRFTNTNINSDEKHANAFDTEHPGHADDFEINVPGCIANSSQVTCSASEAVSWPEEPLHITSFGECFNPERPMRIISHLEDIYSILLQYPPRKPVLVGPTYQVDIPEWEDAMVARNICYDTDVSETAAGRYENELMGTCIIPMPALESSVSYDKVGRGRTDCNCEDKDSIRCVRQHILEAREELRESLGHERFIELGFCEMGEVVADKWSEEEEQLFHKVVFSNPVSMGKNFWKDLASVFPYRTKMDIVSYYFNVFMLWKRSVQNRCESVSIDSDNDEWQGTDDSGNNDVFSDEDEDSVVESPVCQGDFPYHQNQESGLCVCDEDAADETCDNHSIYFDSAADNIKVSETYSGKLSSNQGPMAQLHENNLKDEQAKHKKLEVQDDSCTSSDTGAASQETPVTADNSDQRQGNPNWLNNGGSHGYVSEPCDTKVWDSGYTTTCQNTKMDFLPTCSMIEEVFGDGS
ncbi:hypothetical protein Goarm_015741 [Gossypium armourianum]|uniref:Myb-like domain-containing protein n=1 Tax=Gossypium armourianum TaxID=34283 RepID=A0A7J9JAY3_9ROSI|nr:hypothetical protein [Gossypium armourianum]